MVFYYVFTPKGISIEHSWSKVKSMIHRIPNSGCQRFDNKPNLEEWLEYVEKYCSESRIAIFKNMIEEQKKPIKKAEVELLTKLELRKKEALDNAEKFKNNKRVFNSFIKLSNNIQEEIDNFEANKIEIEKNTISVQNETLLDLLQDNIHTKTYKYSKYNSIDEDKELDEYIKIYKKYSFNEHYEVNHYITKNKLWNKFPNIRSLNDHASHKGIPGILPKYYAQVCEKLEIEGAGGSPLDQAIHY